MNKRIISTSIEVALVLIIITIFLWNGIGSLFAHSITHPFPVGYQASDAFQHQTRAESIWDAGHYRDEAAYISGPYSDVIGFYPPVLYHAAILFSETAGIEIYDGIILFVFLITALAIAVMYFIIRDFNRYVAILSLPLVYFMLQSNIRIGFLWGHWPAIVAGAFLIGLLWSILHMREKLGFIAFSVFTAGIIMTHTAIALFAAVFVAVYYAAKFLTTKININELIHVLEGGLLAFVISLYYLIIFKFTWVVVQPFSFRSPFDPDPSWWVANPGFYIFQFGWVLIPLLIGIGLSILFWFKKNHPVLLFGVVFILLGFGNMIGFSWRAFQLRFMWPILLAVLLGITIYFVGKILIKRWSMPIAAVVSLLIVASLLFTSGQGQCQSTLQAPDFRPLNYFEGFSKCFAAPLSNPMQSGSIMNPFHWEALQFLADKTPQASSIYFFYGDIYGQDALLRNSKRNHFLTNTDDYFSAIQEGVIKREYYTKIPGDRGAMYPYRNGTFTFGHHGIEDEMDSYAVNKDICTVDYIVLDKVSRQPAAAEYNLALAQRFVQNGMIPVFENQVAVILMNPNLGEDCIAEV